MEKKRPNILFLMTDQHRYDALGSINSLVKTPNLDKLAAGGITFTQAVCNAPMCVPSRYSLMLGLYPSQSGVRHNTQICDTDEALPLPVIAQRLKNLGYQTAGFGKTHWYLGKGTAPGMNTKPTTRGFDFRAIHREYKDELRVEPGADLMGDELPVEHSMLVSEIEAFGPGGENLHGYTGLTSRVKAENHFEGWLTNKALDFLDKDLDKEKPFFMYLSFDFPHAGFNVPQGYEELYDINDIPELELPPYEDISKGHASQSPWIDKWMEKSSLERRRSTLRYFALCSYVDDMFGRVLRKLEEQGELDNTFIIFTSDHGEMLGERYRFNKYCLYDSSVRVPLIISGAGVTEELRGTRDERCAELIDVLPTLLEIAGEGIPPELPGISLLGRGKRPGAFAEMHGSGYEEIEKSPAYMWRTKEWKLILHIPGNKDEGINKLSEVKGELYDLLQDPREYNNLYDNRVFLAVREMLTRDLLMYLACMWGRYPRKVSRASLT